MGWQNKFNFIVHLHHKWRKRRIRLLKTGLTWKIYPVVMTASPWNSSTLGVYGIRIVTCQEMWRVGGCHVPDTPVVAWGLGRSCATYQGKPGLWYLTACGFSLIGPINSWNSSNFRLVFLSSYRSTSRSLGERETFCGNLSWEASVSTFFLSFTVFLLNN